MKACCLNVGGKIPLGRTQAVNKGRKPYNTKKKKKKKDEEAAET